MFESSHPDHELTRKALIIQGLFCFFERFVRLGVRWREIPSVSCQASANQFPGGRYANAGLNRSAFLAVSLRFRIP